jgi:hypothetical protein
MNILSLIQNQLSSQTIGQISNAVGEGQEQTKSALSTAFPALLGSLVGKANASPSGLSEIFNTIKQGQLQGGWTDAIGQAISGGPPPAARQSLLSSILGSKLGPVADFIASRCGIRGGSATSLLGMAAPLLMGTLGKQVSSQGLGEAGLGQLLSSQTNYLKDAIPSGLANTLGIGNLLSGTQAPTASARSAEPASRETSYREPASREAYREPARASGGSGILKWAWVPLLLALAAWFVASRANRPSNVGGTPERTAYTAGSGHDSRSATPGQDSRTVAPVQSARTLDFSSLNLTPGGAADNLAKSIASGNWNNTIELNGSTTGGVREISSVLSAAPTVKVRITGRGDTEEAGLSRANAIKNALVTAGISEGRIMTSGQTGTGVPTINLMR